MITRATGFALIGAIFFTAQAHTVQAAVPPLSFEELQQNAQYIFTGKVVDIKEEIRETQALGQSVRDSFYFIKVQVQSAQKGPFEVGQVVTFTAWRPKSRPDGFAGPKLHSGPRRCHSRVLQVELWYANVGPRTQWHLQGWRQE